MSNLYTINEVAKLLGISTDAIRLYEKEGLVSPVRNPQNQYRYYETYQIQLIMCIYLYRQLGVRIAEIRNLLSVSELPDVSNTLSGLIANTELEHNLMKNKLDRLRFMKQHIDNLAKGVNSCYEAELPARYTLYHQDFSKPLYENMQHILNTPIFSFGNFCYNLEINADEEYISKALQFTIREPMMKLSPWKKSCDSFPISEACPCIYTVMSTPIYSELHWDLSSLIAYAKEHHLSYDSRAFAFYVFSLTANNTITDYYEIYLPIIS